MSFNMNPPPPPGDPVMRDTIEKMANFVARNGPNVEETTRQKQAGNSKFSFLYDYDPYNRYYRYRVEVECGQIEAQRAYDSYEQNRGGPGPGVSGRPPEIPAPSPPQFDVQGARQQIGQLQLAIQQSEANLTAQRDAIPIIKEAQIVQGIIDAENGKIARLLQQVNLDVTPLANIMEQLNGKASRDTVAGCKKWILDHCSTDQMREIVLMYLLHRVREPTSGDSFRIHILYLINDWAHYCQRKKMDGQTQMLSRYVPKMYAWISEASADRGFINEKIEKLLGMWEGHKYFSDHCFKQLRNPQQIFLTEKATLYGEHAKLVQTVEAQLQAMLGGYEAQHNEFCNHQLQQIAMIEKQIEISQRPPGAPIPGSVGGGPGGPKSLLDLNIAPPDNFGERRRSRFDQCAPSPSSRFGPRPSRFGGSIYDQTEDREQQPEEDDGDDLDGAPINEEDLIPKCEYWDTPASLMKNRIDIHEFTYKPLDPKAIRLEPPMKPSPVLRHALQMFYADGPEMPRRDEFGWELGALASFFERKMHMKEIQLEKAKAEGKSIEELYTNAMTQEEMDEEMRERERARIEARIAVLKQKDKEDGKSPQRKRRSSSSSSSSSSSASSKSRSRSRGRDRGRARRRSRSMSRSPRRRARASSSRSRSKSPVRRGRSPTPEDYIPPLSSFRQPNMPAAPLTADNKGAMLMAKMGWSGRGLGANESGIQEPIQAGEVRDRGDQFRGLGQEKDAYAEFRKQLSSGYHSRNQKVFEKRARHTGKRDDRD